MASFYHRSMVLSALAQAKSSERSCLSIQDAAPENEVWHGIYGAWCPVRLV